MFRNTILTLSASTLFLFTSCSKLKSLSADKFTVVPTPLEVKAGQVDATITTLFPEKYMQRNVVLTLVPELRSSDGSVVKGTSATFQGEKVLGNNPSVSYRLGGRFTIKTAFAYTPEMQKSDLYVTFNALQGNKKVNLNPVRIGYGVIATSELYKNILFEDGGCLAPDSFERVKKEKQEANIKFLVNQANLRKSELQSNSIHDFVRMLKKINSERESLILNNIEVKAYASPEGGFSFNDKLANKRQNTGEGYVKDQLKANKMSTPIDAGYTAQDWEGFQKLVQVSNIQDKDVILRVLSMYKDPQEREQQIRNMSEGFRELANGILPELRRARLVINYEVVGRSDDEIAEQYKKDPVKLSADELLYYATLVDDTKTEEVYQTAASLYDKDYRAFNNLATLELKKGNEIKAKSYLEQALRVNSKAPEALANLGLIDLMHGNLAQAEVQIANASGTNNTAYATAALAFAKGKYADAERDLADSNTNLAALAHLMNNNYAAAAQTLDEVKHKTAYTHYIHAIVAARRGNKFSATSHLEEALKLNPSLKTYADKDLELKIIK